MFANSITDLRRHEMCFRGGRRDGGDGALVRMAGGAYNAPYRCKAPGDCLEPEPAVRKFFLQHCLGAEKHLRGAGAFRRGLLESRPVKANHTGSGAYDAPLPV